MSVEEEQYFRAARSQADSLRRRQSCKHFGRPDDWRNLVASAIEELPIFTPEILTT